MRAMGADARKTTHNKCYRSFKDFSSAMLNILQDEVPRNWRTYCDEVTDNFRIINPTEFRIVAGRRIPSFGPSVSHITPGHRVCHSDELIRSSVVV